MRKWLKLVLPAAVVIAGATATLVVHAIEAPDPSDPTFLSPISDAPDGAADLAARLTAAGIAVDRRTRTPEAVAAATAVPGTTLFIPAPAMVHPRYRSDLRIIPPSVRVVLVAPTAGELRDFRLATPVSGPRWTAAAPHSGCSEQFAAQPAAVLRWRYGADDSDFSCYDGGVVEVGNGGPAMTLVGAPDPFRNDRLAEHGNAAFATGLLSRGERVVWLDLHEREQPPPADPLPRGPEPGLDEPPDDAGDGDGSGDSTAEPDRAEPQPRAGGSSDDQQGNPLTAAFPPAFWATALLLALALLAIAAAAARRLGAPVPEPLPARVRAAETVRGLGGLYRRAGARDASLATIRAAAEQRLAVHFGVPAAQLPPEVRQALDDAIGDDLAASAAAVQRVVRTVMEGNQK